MSADGLKGELVALAHKQGFFACRIAPAVAPPHADSFQQWLDEGMGADMTWLGRSAARRRDPGLVLEDVRSLVMLGMNYYQGPARPTPRGGRVARYAWGDDYHALMLDRIRPLEELLAGAGGRQRAYVDTGPVLEREYGALSGIGWQGKSTMLIHRRMGTWFFLGEILTTLDLPPDPPERDHCGSCTRCITACPTNAITAPLRLDARRCLSYWTIEHKGDIPEEFRIAMGDRIYGCDDCLDACPWNRFAAISREASFQARAGVSDRPLRELLALDNRGFRELFRNSPILRIRRARFLRNVCVALGNVGTGEDLPALRTAADDPNPLIATHAAWAIGRILDRTPRSP